MLLTAAVTMPTSQNAIIFLIFLSISHLSKRMLQQPRLAHVHEARVADLDQLHCSRPGQHMRRAADELDPVDGRADRLEQVLNAHLIFSSKTKLNVVLSMSICR